MALAFALAVVVSMALGGAADSDSAGALFLPVISRVGSPPLSTATATATISASSTPAEPATPTLPPTLTPTVTPTLTPTVTPTDMPVPPTPSPTKTPTGVMVRISAGPFQMGCDPDRETCPLDNEKPLHTVSLDAYDIDKYEVTNARYQACVLDKGCTEPNSLLSPSGEPYYDDPAYAGYPVIHVTWQQAAAFCDWEDSRLPTEAEWERAARGNTDTRIFPWGDDDATCELTNADVCDDFLGNTAAVGSYPGGASPEGLLDMSGNVLEWVNDWYDADYYKSSPSSNPTGPATGSTHVLRGGSWSSPRQHVRVAYRGNGTVHTEPDQIGFRCARDAGSQ